MLTQLMEGTLLGATPLDSLMAVLENERYDPVRDAIKSTARLPEEEILGLARRAEDGDLLHDRVQALLQAQKSIDNAN